MASWLTGEKRANVVMSAREGISFFSDSCTRQGGKIEKQSGWFALGMGVYGY
jgi:hypothetical protein